MRVSKVRWARGADFSSESLCLPSIRAGFWGLGPGSSLGPASWGAGGQQNSLLGFSEAAAVAAHAFGCRHRFVADRWTSALVRFRNVGRFCNAIRFRNADRFRNRFRNHFRNGS